MSIIAREISTKHFDYHAKTNTFVVEASELPKTFNPLAPIYNDACDAGFYLVSHKTGEKLLFSFKNIDGTLDDVAGWNFVVVPTVACQKNPKLCNIKLLIIND